MANIKSAAKRARQAITRTARNGMRMSAVRTMEKKLLKAIDAGDKKTASELLSQYNSHMARAAKRGIVHLNTAARKVSRIATRVGALK